MKEESRSITGKVVQYGYHRREISKGELGEFSKIIEEYTELLDAHEQSNRQQPHVFFSANVVAGYHEDGRYKTENLIENVDRHS